jgi:riboflavin kinase/FMN adenylyltransferase
LCGPYAAIPADGIYAAWLVRAGHRLPAAVSVGTNPTFAGTERRAEAYVLDFDDDLYGERLALDFVEYLRPTVKFDTIEALVAAIEDDVERTRGLLS